MAKDLVSSRRGGHPQQGQPTPHQTPSGTCHVCHEPAVQLVPGYGRFIGVTSDCKPWTKGGRLGVCWSCGCVQKIIDPAWKSGVAKIYGAYSIYHQSEGAEQPVFDEVSGLTSPRSGRLLARLDSCLHLPETGRLLDIGCGNGALLRAFNRLAPRWSMAGTELDDKYRRQVEEIKGVEAFYTCPPDGIPGEYNLITLVHVLEHILAPGEFLASLKNNLAPGGLLVIEIPEYLQNPFDLLIVDHSTHFTEATATRLLERAGFEVAMSASDWVPKELTLVARQTAGRRKKQPLRTSSASFDSAKRCLKWLESVVAAARKIAARGNLGLFGTSISGTWLFSELKESVKFFVDEDPCRAGKTYMNLPVYHPAEVPAGSHVFIALTPNIAKNIKKRLEGRKYNYKCYSPPPFAGYR